MSDSEESALSVTVSGLGRDQLLEMYRLMYAIRTFEDRCERMHMDGILSGPFHSSAGQEAVAVAVCAALRVDDVVTSTHRGHGHLLAKGAGMDRMLAELMGRSSGYSGGRGGSMHLADMAVGAIGENGIVGGSIFLATGAALGFQVQGLPHVAVAFFGDGAVGQGVLYECFNMAVLWSLPVVFVCENNQYAHSFPARELFRGGDSVDRAQGFGVPATRVDGVDALRIYEAAVGAVNRARDLQGPSLIQADCYRWRGHNLGDAQQLYRTRDEVEAGRRRDPVAIMRAFAGELVPEDQLLAAEEGVALEFEAAFRFASASDSPGPESIKAAELVV